MFVERNHVTYQCTTFIQMIVVVCPKKIITIGERQVAAEQNIGIKSITYRNTCGGAIYPLLFTINGIGRFQINLAAPQRGCNNDIGTSTGGCEIQEQY